MSLPTRLRDQEDPDKDRQDKHDGRRPQPGNGGQNSGDSGRIDAYPNQQPYGHPRHWQDRRSYSVAQPSSMPYASTPRYSGSTPQQPSEVSQPYPYTLPPPQQYSGYTTNVPAQASPNGIVPGLGSLSIGPRQSQAQAVEPVRQTTFERNGVRCMDIYDAATNVRVILATSPKKTLTDPVLYRYGIQAEMMIYGGRDEFGGFFPDFRVQKDRFFSFGRVFKLLWLDYTGSPDEFSDETIRGSPDASDDHGLNDIQAKVVCFIVVREGETFCSVVPIVNYHQQGVAKPGVQKNKHAIAHTGRDAPGPLVSEVPQRGEHGMQPYPIRIVPDDLSTPLDPRSRINFGNVYTVQHTVKVKSFGVVHSASMERLTGQFRAVWPLPMQQASNDHGRKELSTPGERSNRSHRISQQGRSAQPSTPNQQRRPSRRSNEEQDEEEDEDSDDSENDSEQESDDDEQPQVQSSRNNPQASARLSGSSSTAEVSSARAMCASLVSRGYTREQAFAYMVQKLMATNPRMSQSEATAEVRRRLS